MKMESIFYIHNIVGLSTYSKCTKMGVAMGCDATFWDTHRAKKGL